MRTARSRFRGKSLLRLEEEHRKGYTRLPVKRGEFDLWEREQIWDRVILRWPIRIVKGKKDWWGYAVGLPVTAIDDTKEKLLRRMASAIRGHIQYLLEQVESLPSPPRSKRANAHVIIRLR